MTAQQVAHIGYKALMQQRSVIVPGLLNQLMTLAARVMPRSLFARVARSTMEGE